MKTRHLTLMLQFLFGALWLWAGLLKLRDPIAFAEAIRNYRLIGDPLIAAGRAGPSLAGDCLRRMPNG